MEQADRIARAFVDARRQAQALTDYPGTRPATLDDGYAVQDRAIPMMATAVRGWKVGRIPAPLDTRLGANRLAGPIFTVIDASDLDSAGDPPAMPVFRDGFGAAEAEYLIRIAATPADPAALTIESVADIVDAVHIGIEIASSPYRGINADGPTVTVSDFGNNHGLVVGAALPGWRDLSFLDWPVETRINGVVAGRASARTMLDGPLGAVAFLARCLAARGLALRPGDWVSSGAVTGVHEVKVGDRVAARFGEMETGCAIAAAVPQGEAMTEARHGNAAR
ncbi:2-keto-4-pentenoate hydratase [Sphingomonas sp.]